MVLCGENELPAISIQTSKSIFYPVKFEVFTVVTMKNGVFWDVTPCGFFKIRRFGGT
jgi:hypothetical protein